MQQDSVGSRDGQPRVEAHELTNLPQMAQVHNADKEMGAEGIESQEPLFELFPEMGGVPPSHQDSNNNDTEVAEEKDSPNEAVTFVPGAASGCNRVPMTIVEPTVLPDSGPSGQPEAKSEDAIEHQWRAPRAK